MSTSLDLRQLLVDRSAAPSKRTRRRPWLTRYVIPFGVVVGFCSVVAWSARESFLSSKPITVVPVIVTRAEVQQAGTPLFHAAGWVEPRPSPVMVTAMAEGVVEQLQVVAGQEVRAGQPVATLVDADARIAVGDAEAAVQLKEAELTAARATLAAARTQVDHPAHLQAALADAESFLAKVKTELANLPFAIRAAEAQRDYARQNLEGKRSVGEALAGRLLQRAQSDFDVASAALEELQSRGPNLAAEAAALARKSEALRSQLDLKTEETRRLAEAEAGVRSAEARLRQAELADQAAQLRLDRMTVRAPISGRVLAVHAQPGRRVMGLTPASEQDSATVLTLYEPRLLQVRADVRLEDVPRVQTGLPVQIESAVLTEPLAGEVLGATSLADIQKNTLQVKVAIHSPPPVIKPDMLVQVTFLAAEQPGGKSDQSEEPLRLLVPRPLVETSDGGSYVWVADRLSGTARRQAVTLGRAGTDQLVEAVDGLNAMDKLIAGGREGLRHGDRITVTGEDSTLGLHEHRAASAPSSPTNTQKI
ncbi:MAG: efflux RND transporter periplasmic adaptor subunit [Pirellulaceae bacterium]